MEFTFETAYTQKAMTAMARALRKTLRKKRSRRAHAFGWIVIALGLPLTFLPGEQGFVIGLKTVITWLALLLILAVLLFEDPINGYIARKRMLPGMDKSTVTFTPEGYLSATDIGTSLFTYDKIAMIAETPDYFVFMFSPNHAQVYDKSSLRGGTVQEFRSFIAETAHKQLRNVK